MANETPARKPTDREPKRDRKMSFYLTDEERRHFLTKRGAAGHTENTGYLIETLGLGVVDDQPQPA